MSLKYDRIFSRNLRVYIIFAGITFFICPLKAQVPTTTGKNVKLAYANVTMGSPGIIRSLYSFSASKSKSVEVIANTSIPFGTELKTLLDMKGYDQEFTRSFTFTNTTPATFTINNIDFEKKDNKFDFVSIGPDASLPLDVASGQTFTIKVTFHSFDRNKLCSDHLLFITEQSKEPIAYPIQALQQPLSAMPWNKQTASVQSR